MMVPAHNSSNQRTEKHDQKIKATLEYMRLGQKKKSKKKRKENRTYISAQQNFLVG